MTLNVKNVVAGSPRPGGYANRAPLGTALPTDADTALGSGFISQGYVSSEGLVRAITKAYETIRDWSGAEVKRPRTEIGVSLELTLIEAANGEVLKTVYGDDAVTITAATTSKGTLTTIAYKGDDTPPSSWVFDLKDGNQIRRIVAPNAVITTEDFTQTFVPNEVIGYPLTLTLYPDESGNYFFEYLDDGQPTS